MDTKRGSEPNPEHGKPTKEQMWTLLKEYADAIAKGTQEAWTGKQVVDRPQDIKKLEFKRLYATLSATEQSELDKYLEKRLEEEKHDPLELMHIKRDWEYTQ